MSWRYQAAATLFWKVIVAGIVFAQCNASAQTDHNNAPNGANVDYKQQCERTQAVIEDTIKQIASKGRLDASETLKHTGADYTADKIDNLAGFGTAFKGQMGLYRFSFFKGIRGRQLHDVRDDDFFFSIALSGFKSPNTRRCPFPSTLIDRLREAGMSKRLRQNNGALGWYERYQSGDGRLEAEIFMTLDNKLWSFYIGRPSTPFVL